MKVCLTNKQHKSNLDKCKTLKIIVLLSWLSGYIVGPKNLCESSQNKDITDLIFLTSNAGVGFVISYVGAMLWGSIFFGIFLFLSQILCGYFLYIFSKNKATIQCNKAKNKPILTSLSDAIQDSVKTVLSICGFTVFFSVVKSIILHFIKEGFVTLIVASSLEISSGAFASVSFENVSICAFFTGFTVGFGGFCMCMQTFTVCHEDQLSKGNFLCLKLFQGLMCGILSLLFVNYFHIEPIKQTFSSLNGNFGVFSVIIGAIFIFFSLYTAKKLLKNKLYSI